MAGREISIFLKYPGSNVALQRLQHSFLECVVEHKSGTYEEIHSSPPSYLKSDYQLKGTAGLEEDELVVTFLPKHSGIHTVRIFADTRELCRPVAFIVTHDYEVESTPYDRPVKPTSRLFHPITPNPVPSVTQSLPLDQPYGTQTQRKYSLDKHSQIELKSENPDIGYSPSNQPFLRPPLDENFIRGFTSNPVLSHNLLLPSSQYPDGTNQPVMQQRFSHVTSRGSTRPASMSHDEAGFAGDLISMTPEIQSFNQLYSKKTPWESGPITTRSFLSMDHSKVVTPETFEMLNSNIRQLVGSKGMKTRRRCSVCSRKVKIAKLIYLGEHDFCEACFKRQYALRSAIDHFHIPVIKECSLDVPVNKKATKFITTSRTIPDINLRGLEPNEVRYAQEEFKKFDMDNSGWINKVILFPLLKACFSAHLNEKETKHLLTSQSLRSLITSYGLDDRTEVHELEFLSLLAFIAREAISIRGINGPKAGKFSPSDLEMAYAFHNKFGRGMQNTNPPQQKGVRISSSEPTNLGLLEFAPNRNSQSQNAPHYILDHSPSHSGVIGQHNLGIMTAGQGGFTSMLSQRDYPGQEMRLEGSNPQRSPTGQMLNQSARYSGQGDLTRQSMPYGRQPVGHLQQARDDERMSMLIAANTNADHHRISMPIQQRNRESPERHLVSSHYEKRSMLPGIQPGHLSSHDRLLQPLSDAFSESLNVRAGSPPRTRGHQELPEEDQEEPELPTLPPDKDATRHTISLHKKQANSKKIMHDLKLTGDSADSWMMY